VQRQTLGTYVVNIQHAIDATVTRTVTERLSMSVGVPFVAASWGIPSPTTPRPGPRADEDAHGLGDISVSGRYWLLPTSHFTTGNISAGVGVKMPTGNAASMDTPDPYTGASGDATFPNYIFLASYGYRFGSKSGKSDTAICPIDHKEHQP
jgi:hypothetical protein